MNEWQDMVRDFNIKFGATVGDTPAIRDPELRASLIEEEARETIDAIKAGDLVGAVDGVIDLIYVALGALVAWGVSDADPLFAEVHLTNMAKEGGPMRSDGKILKPDGWMPPRIAELLAEQPHRITIKQGEIGDVVVVLAWPIDDILAVHRSIGVAEGWTLTHRPTGRSVVSVDTREEAEAIGRELSAMNLESWASDDPDVVVKSTPHAVGEWIRICRRRGFVPFPGATAA